MNHGNVRKMIYDDQILSSFKNIRNSSVLSQHAIGCHWKINSVTVAREIDYVLKQLLGKVILLGMHPIGQIMNFDNHKKFQNRETGYMTA